MARFLFFATALFTHYCNTIAYFYFAVCSITM